MEDWSDKEKNNYITTYTTPDPSNILKVTDFTKEVNLKKEIKNDIYIEACLLSMNIKNKYYDIQTLDGTDKDYKIFYDIYKFCLLPLYIAPNKESSERLLYAFKN